MSAIDLEREAFKFDQDCLKEEVSKMNSSLENMANDIIAVRQDMANMSARFRSDIVDLKKLILNISANKRGRKQSKSSAGSSTSLAEKREPTNQWKHMKILLTIWQFNGPTCVNLKTTLQIKVMFHKAIVHPTRARLGRTDVCITHHG
jgi:ParB-like chromosome segregation protein Spo0J